MKYFLALFSLFWFLPTQAFSDVPSAHSAAEAINYLSENNIVNGYSDNTFRPNENITRVAFLKILIESDNTDRACTERYFIYNDTESGAWYDEYLQRASNCGFVKGDPDGSFRPAEPINTAEAAKIIHKVFADTIDPAVADSCADQTEPWYQPFTCALEIAGVAENPLDPGRLLTRADMAKLIFNTVTLSPIADSGPVAFPDPAVYEVFTQSRYEALRASKTPFVLNFSASWCPVCRALDNKINSQLTDLPNGSIILKVDYDSAKDLKNEFAITRQTSGVFFDANGNTEVALGSLSYDKIRAFFE